MVPVVIAENRIEGEVHRSVDFFPPRLPTGVFQTLHADGIEVVSYCDADIEGRLLMMSHHRGGNLLLFIRSGTEITESHYSDGALIFSGKHGRCHSHECR